MEGDDDDPTRAYRVAAPTAPAGDAPSSWRNPSAKMLRALASLSRAHGEDALSSELSVRAERVRAVEVSPGPRSRMPNYARCFAALDALRAGHFTAARRACVRWLKESLPRANEDRAEVLLMLAVAERHLLRRADAEAAIHEALTIEPFGLREDAPFEVALLACDTLRAVGATRRARCVLHAAAPVTPIHRAARARADAEDALAMADDALVPWAMQSAARALEILAEHVPPTYADHIGTRIVLARAHLRAGHPNTAERMLDLVLDDLDRCDEPILAARAWAAAAEVNAARTAFARARAWIARAIGQTTAAAPGPRAVHLPVFDARVRVLRAVGDLEAAKDATRAAAAIRAEYIACLTTELR